MKTHVVGDVSQCSTSGFGSAALTWWGSIAFMVLEGVAFALAAGTQLYLMTLGPPWPLNAPPPNHWFGTGVAILMLLSVPLNMLVDRWARAQDLRKVQIGLIGMSLFGIAPLVLRCFEFSALNIRWDSNAYGSSLWFLLGLHTTHLLTDVADTLVLAVLMFTRHGQNPRRFSDTSDNAFYWQFVVLSWLPIYALIYWIPRLT